MVAARRLTMALRQAVLFGVMNVVQRVQGFYSLSRAAPVMMPVRHYMRNHFSQQDHRFFRYNQFASSFPSSKPHSFHFNREFPCFMARRTYRNSSSDDGPNDSNRNKRQQPNNKGRRQQRPAPPLPPPGSPGRGCFRQVISPGLDVWVVQKSHQRTGEETRGTVARLLTNSLYHPRGIKVMLQSGIVGRVIRISNEEEEAKN